MSMTTFKMADIISKKRDNLPHTKDEINYIINGITTGQIPDYQISSWLMAVYLNGMTIDESAFLTESMAKSGDILDLSDIGEYIVDKHSTGGVGDKATLVLIPLLASAGLNVAKLSGRGLGHTGGTIDKLESIPGFITSLEMDTFLKLVKNIGAAIASQTHHLAPADGKIYALRDVTSTVESIPLIAASVLSKKIASGANIIILDIKCGSGAFMKTLEKADELSSTMVEIGKRLDKSITAVITSMDQPLGNTVGNSIEVIESINTLKNNGPEDLKELCLYLGAISLLKAGLADNIEDGKNILNKHLEDGSAFKKFREIVIMQGGNVDFIDNPDKLYSAKYIMEVKSDVDGYVSKLDSLKIAHACKLLGAGRTKKEDKIDHAVGISLNKKIGHAVNKGEVLAKIHANSLELADKAVEMVKEAYEFSKHAPEIPKLIYKLY